MKEGRKEGTSGRYLTLHYCGTNACTTFAICKTSVFEIEMEVIPRCIIGTHLLVLPSACRSSVDLLPLAT